MKYLSIAYASLFCVALTAEDVNGMKRPITEVYSDNDVQMSEASEVTSPCEPVANGSPLQDEETRRQERRMFFLTEWIANFNLSISEDSES